MKWVKLMVPLMIAGSAVGVGAFGSTAASAAEYSGKTVNVGVIDDLTGDASFCGIDEVKGMKLAVKQAKSQGININLEVKDDASTASQGVVALHSLVDSGVSAVLGSCLSSVNEALYPIANSEKTPEIMTTGDDPIFTATPWVYGAAINATTYVAKPVPILKSQGVKTIATIYESDVPSTVSDYKTQLAAEEKAGIKQVGAYPLASTTTDFSPEISEIKALHPDAVAVLFVGTPNVTIVKDMRQEGMNMPILGQVVMQTPFYVQDTGSAANGSIFATDYAPSFPFPSSKAFTKAFESAYGSTPYYASATGYDAAEFLIQALKKTSSTTPAAVQSGLNKVTGFNGAQGVLKVNNNGVITGSGGVVNVKGGKLVYLPPTS